MTTWTAIALILAAAGALGGCGSAHLLPNLKPVVPTGLVKEKVRARVALLVPDTTRSITQVRRLPDGCLPSGIRTGPYGAVFEQTLREMLSQAFEEVGSVASAAEGNAYDAILEATITAVSVRSGCGLSPGSYMIVEGSFRSLDSTGKEIWRSSVTTKRHEIGFVSTLDDLGRQKSDGLSALPATWTREVSGLPMHQYALSARRDVPTIQDATKAQLDGNYRAAVAPLRRVLANDPGNLTVRRQVADLLLTLCDPDSAIRLLEDSLKTTPSDTGLRGQMGLAYALKGDATRTRDYRGGLGYVGLSWDRRDGATSVGRVVPGSPGALAGFEVGDRIVQAGGAPVTDPMELARQVWRAEPGTTLVLRRQRGNEERDLIVTVGSALYIKGDVHACKAQALNREGVTLAREQKPASALVKFEEAANAAPGLAPKSHYNAAVLLEQTGRGREALAHYVSAYQTFLVAEEQAETLTRMVALTQRAGLGVPDTADRRYRVGIIRAQQKRYQDAIQEFEAALGEAPWLVDAYYNLGLVYDFVRSDRDALRAFRTYVQLAPTSPNVGTVKTKIVEIEDRLANPTGPRR